MIKNVAGKWSSTRYAWPTLMVAEPTGADWNDRPEQPKRSRPTTDRNRNHRATTGAATARRCSQQTTGAAPAQGCSPGHSKKSSAGAGRLLRKQNKLSHRPRFLREPAWLHLPWPLCWGCFLTKRDKMARG
jgi:hypothetical protein